MLPASSMRVMASAYWKDSVFILTFDEFGGLYDHVSPQPAVESGRDEA